MFLDVLGSVTLLSEGMIQIQAVLLEKMRDWFREFAKGVANEIATSHATTDREKAEIKRIMRRMEGPGDFQFTEADVSKVLDELEKLSPVEQLEKLGLVDPKPAVPACKGCGLLIVRDSLTYCDHYDARGVAGTTENTGYVKGVQPRDQPSWCPLLPKPEKDPSATENSPDPFEAAMVKVLLTFADGDSTELEVAPGHPLAENASWSIHADPLKE